MRITSEDCAFALQGVLVQGSDKGSLSLQDGTGVLPLQMGQESLKPGTVSHPCIECSESFNAGVQSFRVSIFFPCFMPNFCQI